MENISELQHNITVSITCAQTCQNKLSWVSHILFSLFSRLLLSGNPLDCICENLWIKLRFQEDGDGLELRCIDERGDTQAFATLTPPDCGNMKPCYKKQRWVSDIER